MLALEAGCAVAAVCRKQMPASEKVCMMAICAVEHHAVPADLKLVPAYTVGLAPFQSLALLRALPQVKLIQKCIMWT